MGALDPLNTFMAVMLDIAAEYQRVAIARQAQACFATVQGGVGTLYQSLFQDHGRVFARHGYTRSWQERGLILAFAVCLEMSAFLPGRNFVTKLKYMTQRDE